jgi:hypothetical protein
MEAFAALGKMQRVSEGVLLQSLEKKVMKTDRMGVSIINGQKLPPKLKIPCAAGIFSHGVEDEFYEVLSLSCSIIFPKIAIILFYCFHITGEKNCLQIIRSAGKVFYSVHREGLGLVDGHDE